MYSLKFTLVILLRLLDRTYAKEDEEADWFTLTPNIARFGDIVKFECKSVDVPPRDFVIIVTTPDGNLKLQGGFRDDEKKVFIAHYLMNYTVDLQTECSVYTKQLKQKTQQVFATLKYSRPQETTGTEGPIYSHHDSGMKEKPEDNTNTILIYGLLAGGILIIAILILAMVRTCRKPADDQKRSSGHYENFTNERSPIQPFPGRANLEETYICPADCQEPTYAVSKNPGSTDTYAEPFKPKLEDLYSKPTPKKDRNNVNDLYSQITPKRKETADEVNYAEIDNTTVKGDSNIRGKNDKPVIYAEVSKYANLAQEVLDAKKKMDQKDEYTNVFTNERYCNSRNKSDDYAEPSYCEVNRK